MVVERQSRMMFVRFALIAFHLRKVCFTLKQSSQPRLCSLKERHSNSERTQLDVFFGGV